MNSNQAIFWSIIILYLLLCLYTNSVKCQDCILSGSIKINGIGFQEHSYEGLFTYSNSSNSSNIIIFNLTRTKDIFGDK